MKLLLDTHALLWALRDPAKLSPRARSAIVDRSNDLLVSAASAWEIAIKFTIGKLPDAEPLMDAFPEMIARLGASELPMSARDGIVAGRLAWNHRDPFDRMLVAQATAHADGFVTADAAFSDIGGLRVVW